MIYNGFNREINCRDPWRPAETHGDHLRRPAETTLVSHLPCSLPPNQSVIHLPCPLPPNQSVICLAPCHQTTHGHHPQRPTETTRRDPWRSPAETTCRDHPRRPVETTLVSHLPCPLPPNESVTHLPCPLPPNQSVICLAPCHQTTHGGPQRPPAETTCELIIRQRPPARRPPTETRGDHPLVSHLPCPPAETSKI